MKSMKKILALALVALTCMAVALPALAVVYTPQSNTFTVGAYAKTNTGQIGPKSGSTVAWSAGISTQSQLVDYKIGTNVNGGTISYVSKTGPGNFARTVSCGYGYSQLHVQNLSNVTLTVAYSAK